MNERIKELVEQAKKSIPSGLDPEAWLEVYHSKFAELIVRECAEVAWHYAIDWCPEGESPDYGYARVIKEHFGVES